jgi:N-acetylmuramic acid 6-phosphate etherase
MALCEEPLPLTEAANTATEGLDRLPTVEMLARINDQDAEVAVAVRRELPRIAAAVDAAADALRAGGRLIYVGAGTSGRLGVLDAAECLPTFGVSSDQVFGIIAGGAPALTRAVEGAEDDADAGASTMDAAAVGADDLVVGISASGGAPFVLAALGRAHERGARTVSIANTPGAEISKRANIAIEVVTGPEVIAGSTRLKAGTAQKMVLNMISTGAMIRIGKTYGNRMVDVQATNAKLVARARRLVAELGECSDADAARLVAATGGRVKTAIVAARLGLPAAEAEAILRAADGFLAAALDA